MFSITDQRGLSMNSCFYPNATFQKAKNEKMTFFYTRPRRFTAKFDQKKGSKKMLKKGEKAGGLTPYARFFKSPDPGGGQDRRKNIVFFKKIDFFQKSPTISKKL